jgi:putative SOS response-associated peptidase YedK
MCGRYVSPSQSEIERLWHVGRHNLAQPFERRFNVSPTAPVPMLARGDDGALELALARWGLIPGWWKDAKPPRNTFNARSEEAAAKPMWRQPVAKARCLVPAVGWYEWKNVEQVDPATGEIRLAKQPHFIGLPDGAPFAFAGLMSRFAPEGGEGGWTCSILTREADGPAAEVHDRMPVVLAREAEAAWLDPALTRGTEALALARRHSVTGFAHHPVSTRVNNARSEGAELIEPLKDAA